MKQSAAVVAIILLAATQCRCPAKAAGDQVPTWPCVGDGLTYSVNHGRLVASKSSTSKVRWKFGRDIASDDDSSEMAGGHTILYSDGRVYAISTNYRVYALIARTGRLLWMSARTPEYAICGLDISAGSIFLVGFPTITALNASNGRSIMRIELASRGRMPEQMPYIDGQVILVTCELDGAWIFPVTNAYERRSGRWMWTGNGNYDNVTSTTVETLANTPHQGVNRLMLDKETGTELSCVEVTPGQP